MRSLTRSPDWDGCRPGHRRRNHHAVGTIGLPAGCVTRSLPGPEIKHLPANYG